MEAPLVTAEQLHAWFEKSIKRPSRHPVPGMDLCTELAEQINPHRAWIQNWRSTESGYSGYWRKANAKANVDGRRFRSSLQRLVPTGENPLISRPTPPEQLLAALDRWLGSYGRSLRRQTKTDVWIACAKAFTPHIVETLRKAGWRSISTTDKKSAVIAVLSELIGVVTGDTPPNKASLGSTLRQAAPKPEKKRARNNSSFSRR